jgi:WD40 repeat protein
MLLLRGHTKSIRALAFSPDGTTLASGSEDQSVILWDARSGARLQTLAGHTNVVCGVVFAPDGRALYSCGDDGLLLAWDLAVEADPRLLHRLNGHLVVLAVSPDGKLVATGADRLVHRLFSSGPPLRPPLHVCDPATGQPSTSFNVPPPGQAVWCLAFAPGSRTLAVGLSNGMVRFWDGAHHREVLRLEHTVAVRALAFSPDGALLATAPGTPAEVWELASQTVRFRFGEVRHAIESLAFAPDNVTLLTGCLDSTVRLWSTRTGAEKGRYDWRLGRVMAVAVAPDGMTAAAGGESGDVIIWDVDL